MAGRPKTRDVVDRVLCAGFNRGDVPCRSVPGRGSRFCPFHAEKLIEEWAEHYAVADAIATLTVELEVAPLGVGLSDLTAEQRAGYWRYLCAKYPRFALASE